MRHTAFIAREDQQLFTLAEAPVVDAADPTGFTAKLLPAAVNEATNTLMRAGS